MASFSCEFYSTELIYSIQSLGLNKCSHGKLKLKTCCLERFMPGMILATGCEKLRKNLSSKSSQFTGADRNINKKVLYVTFGWEDKQETSTLVHFGDTKLSCLPSVSRWGFLFLENFTSQRYLVLHTWEFLVPLQMARV